jgi:hypothetical protein
MLSVTKTKTKTKTKKKHKLNDTKKGKHEKCPNQKSITKLGISI